MTVIGGGFETYVGNETLNEHNTSQEDLEVSPDIPDPVEITVDLENDIDQSNNTEIIDGDNITNPDFQTDKAIQLDNQSELGYVFYRVPDEAKVLEVKTSTTSFFELSDITLAEYPTTSVTDFEGNATDTWRIQGISDGELATTTNYIGFRIDAGSDSKIYDLTYKDEPETGFLGSVTAWFTSAGNSIASWFAIISGLPTTLVWIGIALAMIALIVVIMIITW